MVFDSYLAEFLETDETRALLSELRTRCSWVLTSLVKTALSTSEVRDGLRKLIDSGDELLVVDVTGDVLSMAKMKSPLVAK
ncbi:hypothetical protein CH253_04935 [Rhodococcus sp. 06-156-3C]|nr:hypothetical protein CH280_20095 [Rhodococcus sp. 06-156-4C]OZD14462.1 hypothetical protein CH248_24165 [Rhodococcus sp. 06-156-4a]OZD24796.1 hypothetical protein CH253_04935 [Rhodococcus sp. 06-156-3C]OZD27770.1 hypothetical protein CH247_21075 [Rhodococcus sp. 06-156-3b]OZD39751.1 hypothetical protein CH284_04655 [Rhodococcus sp. 06-156-3]OZF60897.1 hypothetical protein CH290_16535 [Rhodococcus sp. 06-156-4]